LTTMRLRRRQYTVLGNSEGEKIMTYEERQREKADYYARRAAAVKKNSDATLEQVHKERDMIPMGQPILVGHHSEGRHRRHLASMNSRERRGWEEKAKADHYAEKAERIENNLETDRVISSDDPEAIPKLKKKLEGLEDQRSQIKESNKKARKEGTDQAAGYILKNLAGNVRSVKVRIAGLEAKANMDTEDQEINGIRIEKNTEENRIRLHFPGKPSAEARGVLKSNGFRWSPRNTAWQRQLNNAGLYAADRVMSQISE